MAAQVAVASSWVELMGSARQMDVQRQREQPNRRICCAWTGDATAMLAAADSASDEVANANRTACT